ncbi:MAG TPA: VOC family protein [Blastocatellia bacterium]|nr:VOC family protein [Blastocatellia bacterium]
MPKDTLIEQLNQVVDAVVGRFDDARRDAVLAQVDPIVASLSGIAEDLLALPSENFRTRLKTELLITAGIAPDAAQSESRDAAPRKPEAPETESSKPERNTMSSKAVRGPVTPGVVVHLRCRNAEAAIDFYKEVFGATEIMRLQEPGGRIGHAELAIANTMVMLADEYPEYNIFGPETLGGSSVNLHLYVDDVDTVAARAVAAGAKLLRPVADQFYGYRAGTIADPFGHEWTISTMKEALSDEELKKRFDALVGGAENAQPEAEAPKAVSPIPEGFHTVTPYLQVNGAARLIDFLTEAFGADQVLKVLKPDGSIMHAEMRVGDSVIETADSGGPYPAMPASIHLYVDDVDTTYQKALSAGGDSLSSPRDQDYGDREASVRDPLGNRWYIATHKLTGKPIPEGLRTITPYFHPRGADRMVDFLSRAFGAEIMDRYDAPDGTIAHARVRIGDSVVEMGEAHGEWGPMPTALHLYVTNADATYNSALTAGAETLFAPRDEPYGDRVGGVTDPFGNIWYIATRIKDIEFHTE